MSSLLTWDEFAKAKALEAAGPTITNKEFEKAAEGCFQDAFVDNGDVVCRCGNGLVPKGSVHEYCLTCRGDIGRLRTIVNPDFECKTVAKMYFAGREEQIVQNPISTLHDICLKCYTKRSYQIATSLDGVLYSKCGCGAISHLDPKGSDQKAAFRAGNQTKTYLTPVERVKMNVKNGYCPHGWSNKTGCEKCTTAAHNKKALAAIQEKLHRDAGPAWPTQHDPAMEGLSPDEFDAKYLTRYPKATECYCGGPAGHCPNGMWCRK